MPIALDAFAARLPELGGTERDAFVLLDLRGTDGPSNAALNVTAAAHGQPKLGAQRAPLCLALAIDASSSMRGGRFALALQAARDVVTSLGPNDRFAVVTFDRTARVVLGPTALDDDGVATARRALDRLATGIGTNLGAGWREAAEGMLRVMIPNAVRRVLVLTDGYPSRGETKPEALRQRVSEGHARGVETSFVGIGDGIDENLCSSLAHAGEGRFHYVRDETGLSDVVASEVEGAKSVVAREVTALLALSPRVERADVLHRFPCKPEGRNLEVRIGALTRDSPRQVLVALQLDSAGEPAGGSALGVASAKGHRSAARPMSARTTMAGFALGPAAEVPDDEITRTQQSALVLQGNGTHEARKRIARELLTLRTAAEVRSAWDAMDTGDREAVHRRLDRARALRRVLLDRGLVDAELLRALPDVDLVQQAMFSAGGEAREARRKFASWAHNTQLSFGGTIAPRRDR